MGACDRGRSIACRVVPALLIASCLAPVVSGFQMQRTTSMLSVSASISRFATTKLNLKPSEKDLFDFRSFDPASIRSMSPADDVDRRQSLVGEDSAKFVWSEQSLSSWMKFAVAVSSVLGVLYVVWLAEWGPQWGEAFTTNAETLAGGNSTVAITLMMLFFAICHSGLASLRPAGEDIVGPRVWRYIFAMVSLPLAYSSIGYFVEHRNDGVQLWDLRSEPWMRPLVFASSVLSFLFLYPSTFNLLEVAAVDEPKLHLWETGIARITRHPQTVGQILWCASHTAYIGTSFACAASAVLCGHHLFSVWNGDRRLRDKFGAQADLLRERTSVVPFAAILSGKQQLPPNFWREEMLRVPYVTILVGSVLAYLAHDQLRGGPAPAPAP